MLLKGSVELTIEFGFAESKEPSDDNECLGGAGKISTVSLYVRFVH